MEKYYIVVEGEKKGPYALSQLRDMWKSGAITMDTKYASEGMTGWADIGPLMDTNPSPPPSNLPPSPRSKVVDELTADQIKQNLSKLAHVELKDCPACGEPVSRDAATCPACGCNFYQRLIRIFLTIVLPSIVGVLALGWGLIKLVDSGYLGSILRAVSVLVVVSGVLKIVVIGGLVYGIYLAFKRFDKINTKTINAGWIAARISLGILFFIVVLIWMFLFFAG